jgi:hypothetical protein
MMVRAFYRCLLRLHPETFRLRFGEQMLCDFEDALTTWGAASLIGDVSSSLLRQWLVRLEIWKWTAAWVLGMTLLVISFGSFLPWDKPLGR